MMDPPIHQELSILVQLIDQHQLEAIWQRCQTILDVRSPGEFEIDHMPGAINMPALTNIERETVGTLYRSNPFKARKIGAVYVLRKIEDFIASPMIQEANESHAFLLYCARGGQRSDSLATVLREIGFPVFRLTGGYKTYRAYVRARLEQPLPKPVIVLHGFSGSRKTHLIQTLGHVANTLDLEDAAAHRGSVLGDFPNRSQPSQKAFETRLISDLRVFRPSLPTLIEGESRAIGSLRIPTPLWNQIQEGEKIWLDLPKALRQKHILDDYCELKQSEFLSPKLAKLKPYLSRTIFEEIKSAISDSNWEKAVDLLLTYHYDPLYDRAKKRGGFQIIQANTMEEAHDRIRRLLAKNTSHETQGQGLLSTRG